MIQKKESETEKYGLEWKGGKKDRKMVMECKVFSASFHFAFL